MKTINVNVADTVSVLDLGRRGETGVTEVVFDLSAWLEEFGAGTAALYVRRPDDAAAYPVALTIEDGSAVWAVSNTDTNVKGYGAAELVLSSDGVVKKSAVWPIYVGCDIGQPTGSPPDPYESWLETLTALGAQAQEDAQAAADSAADASSSASDAADSAEDAEESAQAAAASAEQAAAAAAHGIPAGGTRGQVLTKLSDEDFDADFEDPAGDGGTTWFSNTFPTVIAYGEGMQIIEGNFKIADLHGPAGKTVKIGDVIIHFGGSFRGEFDSGDNGVYIVTGFYEYPEPDGMNAVADYYGAISVTIDDALSSSSKNPVQNKIVKAALDLKAALASPTFTGTPAAPTAPEGTDTTQLATTAFVQRETAKKLPLAGGTMTGAIAMGSHKITGLANGTNNGDAVNLGQVSDMISTNAAWFRGSFASLAALEAVPWQTSNPAAANYVTNNDYAIVLDDEEHDDECWRYVYTTGTGWVAQYMINEAPLTVAQMAALNSGATAQNIAQIAGKIDAPASATAGDVLTFLNGVWAAAAAKSELFVVEATTSPYTSYTEAIAAINAGKHLVLHAFLGTTGNRKEYWLTDYTVGTNSIKFYAPDNASLEHSYILETDGTDDTAVEAYTDWQDSITANGWEPVASRAIYAALALKADAADLHNTAEVTVSSAGAVTQELEINTLYHFTGALTALTITFGAYASGRIEQYHFDFDSGSTAPTLTLPNTVTMPSGFTVEANTHYEIDILNGYGVVSAWATS